MLDQVGGFQVPAEQCTGSINDRYEANRTMWPDKPGLWDFVSVLVTGERLVMLR